VFPVGPRIFFGLGRVLVLMTALPFFSRMGDVRGPHPSRFSLYLLLIICVERVLEWLKFDRLWPWGALHVPSVPREFMIFSKMPPHPSQKSLPFSFLWFLILLLSILERDFPASPFQSFNSSFSFLGADSVSNRFLVPLNTHGFHFAWSLEGLVGHPRLC